MKLKKDIAISDSGFLFNPSSGDSYSLNPIGVEIFKLLQKEKKDEDIIKHLTNEYAIDESSVEKDLYDFKIMLSNYKLIN
ncbi:MAG: PqqD family protein [Bacteroidetes bacterium]|nr:PqqD family protein [Bacteroidota bacterium]